MTVRTRRPERGIRTRVGRLVETEEKQQALVTVTFIAAIVAVVLILIAAVGVGWYNDNLRPLGKAGSVEIAPQMLKDRVALETWRIARDENRVTQAQVAGTLDASTAQTKTSALDTRNQSLATNGLSDLVDILYQSQLASDQGIAVSQADVDARYNEEISDPEQRHVFVIAIAPQAADATNGPTAVEQHAALDKATQALAALQSGQDFATVAQQFGTDAKSQAGGDLGNVTQLGIADDEFGTELFALDQGGTTGIVRGGDGTYRIGRVTEIMPGNVNAQLKNDLLKKVPEQNVRQMIGYEVAAQDLKAKVTNDALAATPEQVKVAVIYIAGLASDAEASPSPDGEIDYSEIVFAPNDNLDSAPTLAADDPAWATAQQQANDTMAQLQAITDPAQRKAKFTEIATSNSDDPTSQDGGAVGYVTRDTPPQAVADALWNGTHQKGDLIGPVRGDAAYYVLMFNDKRASIEDRVKAVQTALAAPGADFNAIASQLSEGPEKADGGEIGWLTRDQLSSDIADKVFALNVGQVSDPLPLGQGQYFIKVEDKQNRAYDPDQVPTVRQNAFSDWYQPKKDQATSDGTIVTNAPTSTDSSLSGGGDQALPTP